MSDIDLVALPETGTVDWDALGFGCREPFITSMLTGQEEALERWAEVTGSSGISGCSAASDILGSAQVQFAKVGREICYQSPANSLHACLCIAGETFFEMRFPAPPCPGYASVGQGFHRGGFL